MFKKIYRQDTGQAVAELALALIILLPLAFWMLRLGTLLNLRHKAIEFGRLAAWEKAYGRDEPTIAKMVEDNIRDGALFSSPSQIKVNSEIRTESSSGDFAALLDIPRGLGLNQNNYFVSNIRVQGELLLGIDFSLNNSYALLADPWNLTDRAVNGRIDDDDLADAVNGIYFWIPGIGPYTSGPVRSLLDTFSGLQRRIRNLPVVGRLLSLAGVDLDIDPRGHPRLAEVPKPSGH